MIHYYWSTNLASIFCGCLDFLHSKISEQQWANLALDSGASSCILNHFDSIVNLTMTYICAHFQWLPKCHLSWHKIIYFCAWACSAYFPLFSKYLLIIVQGVIAHNISTDVCLLATDYYDRGPFQFVIVVEVRQNWTSGHGRIKVDAK